MPKTKVLYILPWLRTGGSERYVANLCRNLDRERFETVVLYRGEWGPIGDELKAAGIRTVHNPMKVYRPDQLFGFYRLLRKEGIDIVHSLNYRPNFTDALLTKWAGRKFVSSRRNLRFWKGSDKLHWGERLRNQPDRPGHRQRRSVEGIHRRLREGAGRQGAGHLQRGAAAAGRCRQGIGRMEGGAYGTGHPTGGAGHRQHGQPASHQGTDIPSAGVPDRAPVLHRPGLPGHHRPRPGGGEPPEA